MECLTARCLLQGMQSLSGGICSGESINIPAAVLPISPATNFTVNFTSTAAIATMPNLTTVLVSLNGTNTTEFILPATGGTFQARIGNFTFEGRPHLSAAQRQQCPMRA